MDPNKMHVKVEENEEDDDMDIVDPKEIEVEAEVTELSTNPDEIRLFEEAAKAQAAKLAELGADSSSS